MNEEETLSKSVLVLTQLLNNYYKNCQSIQDCEALLGASVYLCATCIASISHSEEKIDEILEYHHGYMKKTAHSIFIERIVTGFKNE